MSDAISVTLGKMADTARKWVERGDFGSVDEAVLEGLHMIEQRQQSYLAYLQAEMGEALDDHRPGTPVTEAFAEIRARIKARR